MDQVDAKHGPVRLGAGEPVKGGHAAIGKVLFPIVRYLIVKPRLNAIKLRQSVRAFIYEAAMAAARSTSCSACGTLISALLAAPLSVMFSDLPPATRQIFFRDLDGFVFQRCGHRVVPAIEKAE